ncbi:Transcriptional coactivator [Komagataella phaffii]|uniref:Transcriptional coactivator HFI1/ADA1 n=2 Tax=Komagataella phaffii TaxID=460519 RepID=C4QZA3_KOMPG|nr:Transcriptional coactivator HFI1/ADA1 [Komagataella phaffii GS115]6TB4_A Chain A, Transcriptional coactivator HFI1/ADA1 [Komagataella phaffii GS115]6TBM_A Chain A, Transcriptional coactivator HFI1/ADA1 [Komagataella phaffii GS115]AOA60960.1 GQ67_01416T0 [Komagataella phaffii]AOA65448.1 GQ68_01432T0 [Komagataella phaffii GS115]CAY68577.1 Transcriptional coactivator HFI1/ADA1 [Komagataella phaffii GS115]
MASTELVASTPMPSRNGQGSHQKLNGGNVNSATNTPTVASTPVNQPRKLPSENFSGLGGAIRIEIEPLVVDFQRRLGKNWGRYQIAVSLFLVGKLSRRELVDELDDILDRNTVKMHNQLLLGNLANSLKESAGDRVGSGGFGGSMFNKRVKDSRKSSQYERLKRDILALPVRERRRIKAITRESGKKGMVNSVITQTRQALIPKVPVVTRPTNVPGNSVQWAQDVIHGFQALLASEIYELPEMDNLRTRMTGISREHGLIGPVDDSVIEIMLIGLEQHLKGIVEAAIDIVKYRRTKYTNNSVVDTLQKEQTNTSDTSSSKVSRKRDRHTLTIEDMYDTLEQYPYLVEPGGTLLRLQSVMLHDEDELSDDEILKHILKPRTSDSTDRKPKQLQENGTADSLSKVTKSITNGANASGDAVPNGKAEHIQNTMGTKEELNWFIYDILSNNE